MKSVLIILTFILSFNSLANSVSYSCPLKIVAGKSIGPISFKSNLQSIEKLFPSAKIKKYEANSDNGSQVFVENDGLNISFCNGLVTDIWVDLQRAPDNCIIFNEQKILRTDSIKKYDKP